MTQFDEDVLTDVMQSTQAWEQLNNPEYSGQLKMSAFKALLLRAGYSKEDAGRLALQRGNARLDAGEAL